MRPRSHPGSSGVKLAKGRAAASVFLRPGIDILTSYFRTIVQAPGRRAFELLLMAICRLDEISGTGFPHIFFTCGDICSAVPFPVGNGGAAVDNGKIVFPVTELMKSGRVASYG